MLKTTASAFALAIGVGLTPAMALDVGVGGNVGATAGVGASGGQSDSSGTGVGLSAESSTTTSNGVSVGSDGATAGVTTNFSGGLESEAAASRSVELGSALDATASSRADATIAAGDLQGQTLFSAAGEAIGTVQGLVESDNGTALSVAASSDIAADGNVVVPVADVMIEQTTGAEARLVANVTREDFAAAASANAATETRASGQAATQ